MATSTISVREGSVWLFLSSSYIRSTGSKRPEKGDGCFGEVMSGTRTEERAHTASGGWTR